MEFDSMLPQVLENLREDDLLIITADHGNDPGYKGTDHTREQIPAIVYSKKFNEFGVLEDRDSFADIGATIEENFQLKQNEIGKSFLNKLK